jgi:thiamine-phosphate pyrophosphorylase
LLAITDGLMPGLEDAVRMAAEAGGPDVAILLRAPGAPMDSQRRAAGALLPICREAGTLLLVHGSAALAREIGADGVHLPERASVGEARARLGAGALVGASRHDGAGVLEAHAAGASYATLSPIFATPGKGVPFGVAVLAALCRTAPLPIVALGGITPERAAACRAAGAAAAAAIRAVWSGDVAANVRRLAARA